jgi:hypothetical protein
LVAPATYYVPRNPFGPCGRRFNAVACPVPSNTAAHYYARGYYNIIITVIITWRRHRGTHRAPGRASSFLLFRYLFIIFFFFFFLLFVQFFLSPSRVPFVHRYNHYHRTPMDTSFYRGRAAKHLNIITYQYTVFAGNSYRKTQTAQYTAPTESDDDDCADDSHCSMRVHAIVVDA